MLSSMAIAVPTGVKVLNWVATLFRGSISARTPLYFAAGFLVLFTLGGITGVMLAIFPIDRQVTDTYFVVAHFHFVLVAGAVSGVMAALYYWFPKMTGRMLSEGVGKLSFWLQFVGFLRRSSSSTRSASRGCRAASTPTAPTPAGDWTT